MGKTRGSTLHDRSACLSIFRVNVPQMTHRRAMYCFSSADTTHQGQRPGAPSTPDTSNRMTELLRILSLMAASIEGKLPPTAGDEAVRIAHIQELLPFVGSMPSDLLCRPATFPALSYLFSALVNVLVGSASPRLRIEAGRALCGILHRHPSDEFVAKVMPGLCTLLLKFLPAWEKEPVEAVSAALNCLGCILRRGYRVAQQQAKLGIILDRLHRLASGLAQGPAVVIAEYRRVLENLLNQLVLEEEGSFYKGHCKTILAGLAMLAAHSTTSTEASVMKKGRGGERANREIDSLILQLLHDGLEALIETELVYISCTQLNVLSGLFQMTEGDFAFWGNDQRITTVLLDIATRLLPRNRLLASLREPSTVIDGRWAWRGEPAIVDSVGRLVGATNKLLIPQINRQLDPSAESLLILARCLDAGHSSTGLAMADMVDFLVEAVETFCCRDLSPAELDKMEIEQEFWLAAWCACVDSLLRGADITGAAAAVLDYLCRPLLMISGSVRVTPTSNCAQHLLTLLAEQRLQGKTGDDDDDDTWIGQQPSLTRYLWRQAPALLSSIAADLRYPTIYPRAPLALSQLLGTLRPGTKVPVTSVLDLVREVGDRAAQLQHCPGYALLLLQAMQECAELARGHFTPPSENRQDEEEEATALERAKSLEEELASSVAGIAINFLTDDQVAVRLAALRVLDRAVAVFVESPTDAKGTFLPLAHQMWGPLLGRLRTDPSLEVARHALALINGQCQIAGDFLADRIQRELLPLLGGMLAREAGLVQSQSTIVPAVVSIIQRMGRASSRTIRGALTALLGLCGTSVGLEETVRSIEALACVDSDHVWFVLAVQWGGCGASDDPQALPRTLTHPSRADYYPPIDTAKFQKGDHPGWSKIQRQAVTIALRRLYPQDQM